MVTKRANLEGLRIHDIHHIGSTIAAAMGDGAVPVVQKLQHINLGNSGTGKTHVSLALGLAACQRGFPDTFFTAAGLVHQLMEARDERRLLKLHAQLAAVKLFNIDELGYVCAALTDRRGIALRRVQPAL
jgi:hypothetical protein